MNRHRLAHSGGNWASGYTKRGILVNRRTLPKHTEVISFAQTPWRVGAVDYQNNPVGCELRVPSLMCSVAVNIILGLIRWLRRATDTAKAWNALITPTMTIQEHNRRGVVVERSNDGET